MGNPSNSNSAMTNFSSLFVTLHLIISNSQRTCSEQAFVFPEFDFVESPKNVSHKANNTFTRYYVSNYALVVLQEIAWREWEAACEQTPACLGLVELEKLRCVRKCMSPSCYNDIYSFDEVK